MIKTKLLISFFVGSFLALTSSPLEAKSRTHFNLEINAGVPVRNSYAVVPPPPPPAHVVVQTAPIFYQSPTTVVHRPAPMPVQIVESPAMVHTAVVPTQAYPPQYYTTETYAVPAQHYTTTTYAVPAQPVVVAKKRPAFHWGFNWGFFFR